MRCNTQQNMCWPEYFTLVSHLYHVLPVDGAGNQRCRWWCWQLLCFLPVSGDSSENLYRETDKQIPNITRIW